MIPLSNAHLSLPRFRARLRRNVKTTSGAERLRRKSWQMVVREAIARVRVDNDVL